MSDGEGRLLIYNALKTPDGTVLESRHRNDYKTHIDANGKEYMVDGGVAYLRRSGNGDEVDLSVYDDAPHELQRVVATWGTRGKGGKEPLKLVAIAEMSDEHLKACLATQPQMAQAYRKLMENELKYREANLEYAKPEKEND